MLIEPSVITANDQLIEELIGNILKEPKASMQTNYLLGVLGMRSMVTSDDPSPRGKMEHTVNMFATIGLIHVIDLAEKRKRGE